MRPGTIAALAVITLITVVAAVVAAVSRPEATALRIVDEPAFPELRASPDAVASVTIETADGTVTLERSAPNRWVMPEREGYPVAERKVRELIVQLADMRLIERKTARPERFSRLEVQDVDAEDAKSRLVRLENDAGDVLAEAILGKRRQRPTGVQPSGIYLRRPGETQSWLASGGVDVVAEVQAWLDTQIVDLPVETVQRVALDPADADAYAVVRAAEGDGFTIEPLADGETVEDAGALERVAGALAGLELLDVRRIDAVGWQATPHRATFTTEDGLRVDVELIALEDGADEDSADEESEAEVWARFDAAMAEPGGDDAKGAMRERARRLDDRLSGWAYRLPGHLLDRLTKPREAWLADDDGTS